MSSRVSASIRFPSDEPTWYNTGHVLSALCLVLSAGAVLVLTAPKAGDCGFYRAMARA